METLPMLIKRCLAYGINVYPFQLNGVLSMYERYKIPDEQVAALNGDQIRKYVEGLFLSSCEYSCDWTRGHALLKEIGFTEKTRSEGHRSFVTLEWYSDGHSSDCATHNEPAFPNGECDCKNN